MSKALLATLLAGFSACFTITGYEFIRSSSNTLFKGVFGSDALIWVGLAMAPVLFLSIFVYGWILSKLGARKTWITCYAFAAGTMVFSYFAYHSFWPGVVWPLVVFRKIYIVILIEQYWSFLNSTFSTSDGKKFNGLVLFLSSMGGVGGGYLGAWIVGEVGTSAMLLLSAAALLPAALLSDWAIRSCGEPEPAKEEKVKEAILALPLFRKSPLLLGLLVIVLATQVLSTSMELNFQTLLQIEYPIQDEQTAYSNRFFGLINGLGGAIQLVLAPVLLSLLPLWLIHFSIPLIHVVFAVMAFFDPSLAVVGTGLIVFKSLDYSLFRAGKEIFYIPLSFDARYRSKQVIDVFGYRLGEGVTSLGILGLKGIGVVYATSYSALALGATLVWGVCLLPVLGAYKKAIAKPNPSP